MMGRASRVLSVVLGPWVVLCEAVASNELLQLDVDSVGSAG